MEEKRRVGRMSEQVKKEELELDLEQGKGMEPEYEEIQAGGEPEKR